MAACIQWTKYSIRSLMIVCIGIAIIVAWGHPRWSKARTIKSLVLQGCSFRYGESSSLTSSSSEIHKGTVSRFSGFGFLFHNLSVESVSIEGETCNYESPEKDATMFEQLATIPTLKSIYIHQRTGTRLPAGLVLQTIETLSFHAVTMDDNTFGTEILAPRLTRLTFWGCYGMDVARLPYCPNLSDIELLDTPNPIGMLEYLESLPNLRSLQINVASYHSQPSEYIFDLPKLLNLSVNGIYCDRALVKRLSNLSHLKTLELNFSELDSATLDYFRSAGIDHRQGYVVLSNNLEIQRFFKSFKKEP